MYVPGGCNGYTRWLVFKHILTAQLRQSREVKFKCELSFITNDRTSVVEWLTKTEFAFYAPFNSQGHTGTGPQHLSLVGSRTHTQR